MPKFTIEMTFDVPHYRQTVYEAETLEEAIAMARADDDWEHQDKDYDTSGPERITGIWTGEEAYEGESLPVPAEGDTATAAQDLEDRIMRVFGHYEDVEPEEGETWESWYRAAFDMASDEVRRVFADKKIVATAPEVGE